MRYIISTVSVMKLMSVLLCLLFWSLVEVYSQTEFPYVSFMGENLTNHGYVNLILVGRDYGDPGNAVRCHTDLTTCCTGGQGVHRGDWYFPNGDRLPFSEGGNIYEGRDDRRVHMHRRNNANSPSGIYRCDVQTNDDDISVRETVYVGVYATGGDISDVSLTVNSDLNGSSPQFTLTCISTGGPASTVTWTRDSVTVTERTETVLDDPVTAQYTHTLTMTGRLGGLYTCTVANNKPSRDSSQLYVLVQPESVIINPVNAIVVRVSWSNIPHLPTSLEYSSYFTATGAMISHYETVLSADVNSSDITIDIDRDGYEHNFTLQYISTNDYNIMITPAPVTTATFAFDKKYFQIQFGPIDCCLSWGLEKTGRIEDQLQSQLTLIIRERCTDCYTFSTDYLRRGQFLCHDNPTTVTYRSTLINPFPTTNSTELVGIIQSWVLTSPSLVVDGLTVRVAASCPTCIASLDDEECVSVVESDSGLNERIRQVLSVCAVRELGQEICTI